MSRFFILALMILCACLSSAFSQDTITIPRSRLEELERKEAELEKLKGALPKASAAVEKPAQQTDSNLTSAGPDQNSTQSTVLPAAPKTETPSIASLPPIDKDGVVSAADLAAHYRADATAADARYRKQTFKVEGDIVGFEKPPLIRNYHILLRTGEPRIRVICDFYPPENFKSVYTINAGMDLVGNLPRTQIPIAKVGDRVLIEGRCKGLAGGGVKLTDCELKRAPE